MKEKRKVQRLGKSTLVISLPKMWTAYNNVERGDELVLNYIPESDYVLVRKIENVDRECEISVDKNVEWVIREIVARYIQGYDRIKVTGIDSWKVMKRIKNSIEKILFGIDIVEKDDVLLISVVVSPERVDLDDMVVRCCISLQRMISSLLEGVMRRDTSLLKDVVKRDDDLDRMVLLARRQLNLKSYEGFSGTRTFMRLFGYSSLLQKLETIGDCLESIALHVMEVLNCDELYSLLNPPLIKLSGIINKVPRSIVGRDRSMANYVVDESVRYPRVELENLRKNLTTMPPEIMSSIANITENLSRISQAMKEIGELSIDSFI